MPTRRKLSARAAAVLVTTLLAVTMVPGPAHALGTNQLVTGSTVNLLGQTFTLSSSCANFINDPAPAPAPTCSPFTGTPSFAVTANTTLTGTMNTAGSTVVLAGGFKLTFSSGPCEIIITSPKTLTYSATAPASYRNIAPIGSYSFGSCPPSTQAVFTAQLGAGGMSTVSLSFLWGVS